MQAAPVLQWQGLPGIADTRLLPGLSLLLDEEDALNPQLVAYLGGHALLPAGACLQCAGLPSTSAVYAQGRFWHQSAVNAAMAQQPINTWLAAQQNRWPQWDAALWSQHSQGFALEPHLGKNLHQLSTGTLRKLWLAAALVSGASLILLDQPEAGLDISSERYLAQALNQWADAAAQATQPRWLLVLHFADLVGVQWDEVVEVEAV